MPVRRVRNAGTAASKEQLSREMRRSRLSLFIQQFEKEAQERMNDLEAKMENMLATIDKVFKVELMKMPQSLQKTLIGDLIAEDELAISEVSIAMKNESLEVHQSLRRLPNKQSEAVQVACPQLCESCTTSWSFFCVCVLNLTVRSHGQSTPTQRTASKTSKGLEGTKRTRTLVGSSSTGNLGGPSLPARRAQSRLTKTVEQTVPAKPKLRSVVSAGDLHCSMAASAAHITVTTARGQAVSFSEETKHEINLDVLDDVAWCQIQKLTSLMDYLSRHGRCPR
ncbi:borealin-2 isoform X1 [Antennarius striatus]|uniref:borealin-2 isoform X1 n=1 Tax=Antennarius striatus TaxID=241820 RepID=UPI0035B1AD69